MPVTINPEDIAYAENILLPPGEHFDEERVTFIQDLRTLDLQAVPGSGKTTALLAKLLILDRYLPFEGGTGILVLSHTNAAVNEIKERIGLYCNNLFKYPNFIGTIQAFVDEFLCIPYYKILYNHPPERIDDQVYYRKHYVPVAAKAYLESNSYQKWNLLYGSRLFDQGTMKIGMRTEYPIGSHTPTYKAILTLKQQLQSRGYLCFDDAYILGSEYLLNFPIVLNLLRKRFSCIFVDEMQDMDLHQYELLENIFATNSTSIYQRIGDINQAIFSFEIKDSNIWISRQETLTLNGSYRLHPNVAEVVEPFGIYSIKIEGRRKVTTEIKPHLIVYEDQTIDQVLPTYAKLVEKLVQAGVIEVSPNSTFKAIGWRKNSDSPAKTSLKNFFPNYSDIHMASNDPTDCLKSAIDNSIVNTHAFDEVRNRLINIILFILREEDVSNEIGFLSEKKLLTYFRLTDETFYNDFKLRIFEWGRMLLNGDKVGVLEQLRNFAPVILAKFSKDVKRSERYLFEDCTDDEISTTEQNTLIHNELKIEVCSVHSVKGQTMATTLYLETFHGRGQDSHESGRLAEQFLGNPFTLEGKSSIQIQSAKMAYVGFSRCTHLLCVAVHKDRFNKYIASIDRQKWDITEL